VCENINMAGAHKQVSKHDLGLQDARNKWIISIFATWNMYVLRSGGTKPWAPFKILTQPSRYTKGCLVGGMVVSVQEQECEFSPRKKKE
jgi:hypothetical protein